LSDPALSIVLPAYNEGSAIEAALRETLTYVDAQELDAEVIVVDDGSADDTRELAERAAAADARIRVLSHRPNRGKGYAVTQGMLAARGAVRIFYDVDLATPVEHIAQALAAVEAGADVILGSRHLPESRIEIRQSARRELMGRVFRWITRLILRLPVTDVTCGFKAFTAAAAQALFPVQTESGWAFDAEFIHVAHKWGMAVQELPVTWRDAGGSTVRPFAAARDSLAALLRIRRNDRRGLYDDPRVPEA
jgi:glycosyltransferase involved in cell wall biosynthesis